MMLRIVSIVGVICIIIRDETYRYAYKEFG